ncbi:unnamed protein product, partial [Rhizoctonia solani]
FPKIFTFMSLLSEDNNSRRVFSEALNEATPYQRDPKYYYPDGSVVILVGDVLFKNMKFQLSLVLCSHNTNDTSSRGPAPREQLINSNDNNPVKLKGFIPDQFRNFMSVIVGLPSDTGYLALLTGAQDIKNHTQYLLIQYLDVASISQWFGMTELEKWARGQLQLVLRSHHKFAHNEWDKDTLHRLHSYAHSSGGSAVRLPVKILIQYFISISADKDQRQPPAPSNFMTCIELFKDETLKQRDSSLFGCVFSAIVSQPHREWTSTLTQKDKALLYVAQVQLTSISNVLQSIHWLLTPPSELPFFTRMCSTCHAVLPRLWRDTFGKCGNLNSSVLLQDISSLARLPQYYHSLSQTWGEVDCMGLPSSSRQPSTSRPFGIMGYTSSLLNLSLALASGNPSIMLAQHAVSERPREGQRCCTYYLPRVTTLMDEVYNELAGQYTRFAP